MKRLTLALFLFPSLALAHPGHETGAFGAGFAHPFGGADHLLAMLALGLWAAQAGGRAVWALPVAFLGAMLAGGSAGAAGFSFPAVEPVILASVIVLGAMVALAARLPLGAAVVMAALFGWAHGWAHGAEGPASGLLTYAAGFVAATALLHLAGIGIARGTPRLILRGAGGALACAGAALMVMA